MILVDTSVWIDHFRRPTGSRALIGLLEAGDVGMHPFVLGEIALGRLGAQRDDVLRNLARLPRADIVPDDEVLAMVDARRLAGSGIRWVDAHLVASALVRRWHLWTFDGALLRVGSRLDVVVPMP